MAGYASPVGDTGSAVLVAAGITAIRISLHMPDQNRQITVIDIFIHQNRVTPSCGTQIYHVFLILTVMTDNLPGMPELVEQLLPENGSGILFGTSWVKAVRDDQKDILFLHTSCIQFFQNITDTQLPVAGRLFTALDPVGNNKGDRCSFVGKFGNTRHANRMGKALKIGLFQLILRYIIRVFHGFSRNKDVGIIRKARLHGSLSIFKCYIHLCSSYTLK